LLPGNYTIQIAAPGFRTTNLAVTLSDLGAVPSGQLGCRDSILSTDAVVLLPGDGGPGDGGPGNASGWR
jgi:hypothetical protein